jgi:hypothetical protein
MSLTLVEIRQVSYSQTTLGQVVGETRVVRRVETGPRGLPGPPGGIDAKVLTASEDLTPGSLVNIWMLDGQFVVRRADASSLDNKCHGFCPFGANAGSEATCYFSGNLNFLAGLVPGDVFLSTNPGEVTQVAPSGSGQIVQVVGYATSESSCTFEPGEPIQRA